MLPGSTTSTPQRTIERGVWSEDEHDKFLVALKLYPKGPWKTIAEQIGTRSARQVQTHAQKYYEKVARRVRGLRKDRKKLARAEHRLDDDMVTLCKVAETTNSAAIGPIRNGLNAVRAIPKEIFALRPASASTAVEPEVEHDVELEPDAQVEIADLDLDLDLDLDDAPAPYRQPRRDSIESLLEDGDDDSDDNAFVSEYTDSDDSDSLLGFDDAYLDYLIEILDASSCTSDASGAISD